MEIKFLSFQDQSNFLHMSEEIVELFSIFRSELEIITNYDSLMLSVIEDRLLAHIEGTPFSVEFNDLEQQCFVYSTEDENHPDEFFDFEEDSVLEMANYIGDHIFDDEEEHWKN